MIAVLANYVDKLSIAIITSRISHSSLGSYALCVRAEVIILEGSELRKSLLIFKNREILIMRVYWKDVRRGQNLVLTEQEGEEQVIGGFRETKRGIDAYAQTFGYEPGRSQKGFATIEDAMDFVESFKPWELHGVQDVTVEHEARPVSEPESMVEPDPPVTNAEPAVLNPQSSKGWWEFWRRD